MPHLNLHLALQTKNVSGRLLVGLRWWNETTDEGSNWRFETLEEVSLLNAVLHPRKGCAGRCYTHDLRTVGCTLVPIAGPAANKQERLCMFLVVPVHHGGSCNASSIMHACAFDIGSRHATSRMSTLCACLSHSSDVQPVAWLALGIIALVKVSVGKHFI